MKQKINYAELYGVRPGELDFSKAIERSVNNIKEHGLPNLNEFIKIIKK